MPDARSVFAVGDELRPRLRPGHAGRLEGRDVVPDRRLVGALEDEAVELPVDGAELAQTGAKLALSCGSTNGIGLSAPLLAKSLTRPGWPSTATSGGFPPWIAVASTVGSWSPADVYVTETPGFTFLNPSITAWNDFCSAPVQIAMTAIFPLTACVFPLFVPPPPAVPTAASRGQDDRGREADGDTRCLLIPFLSSRVLVDPEARFRVEEVQRARVHCNLQLLPSCTRERAPKRPIINASAVPAEATCVAPSVPLTSSASSTHLRGSSRRGVDREVHHDLGAERLAQLDAPAQPPVLRRIAGERRVLEILGRMPRITVCPSYPREPGTGCERLVVDADPLAAGDGRRARRSDRSSVASTMFIEGLPMKPPTKRLTGRSYSSCGSATCCSSPFRITATRSPIVIASTWSCVT